MAITSLRTRPRADNLQNQSRASQSLARRIYLGVLGFGVGWIGLQFLGPMVLLNADGLIVQDREVIGADYEAQVVSMIVRPGDHVFKGQRLGTVTSTQMLDLISDLTTRLAQANSRREQIDARLAAIQATVPAANDRVTAAKAAASAVEQAARHGLATTTRRAELAHEYYDAERDAQTLKAEAMELQSERVAVIGNSQRLSSALDKAQTTYGDGAIISPYDGIVGPKVATPGTVLRPGDPAAEVHHGLKFVVAYLPINRLYTVRPGDPAIVSDGATQRVGRIERVEGLADTLPGEFQPSFVSLERRQIIRISIDNAQAMPLLAKVHVSDVNSPSNLAVRAQDYLTKESSEVWRVAQDWTAPAVARFMNLADGRPTGHGAGGE